MKKKMLFLILIVTLLSCNNKEEKIFISKLHTSNKKNGKIWIRRSQTVKLHSAIKDKRKRGNNHKVKIRKNLTGSER